MSGELGRESAREGEGECMKVFVHALSWSFLQTQTIVGTGRRCGHGWVMRCVRGGGVVCGRCGCEEVLGAS